MGYMVIALTFLQVTICSSDRNFGHERIVQNLLDNYGLAQKLVRPSANTSVGIGIGLHTIRSFDDKTGKLNAGYWLRETWKDERLVWEDDSVGHVRLPIDKIWRPDFRLWNSNDKDEMVDTVATPLIYRDGTVLWVPPAEYNTHCEPPVGDSNEWTCALKMGSWTQNGYEIGLSFYNNQTEVDLMAYNSNLNGWEVKTEPGSITDKYYDCCTMPYTSANFIMKLSKITGGVADVSSATSNSLSLLALVFVGMLGVL